MVAQIYALSSSLFHSAPPPLSHSLWAVWEGRVVERGGCGAWLDWKGDVSRQGKEGLFSHESPCIGLLVMNKIKQTFIGYVVLEYLLL